MVEPVTVESVVRKTPHPVNQVTKLSTALAWVLFVVLPFVGVYIGYRVAPERLVQVSVPTEPLVNNTNLATETIAFKDIYNETNITKYSIRNGVLFYEETNVGIAPKLPPVAYAEDVVLVDGKLLSGNVVLESTASVTEIVPGVFLTDTTIYRKMMTEGGEMVVTKAFANVSADTIAPVSEFTDASSSTYVRPLVDGGYVNRWFTDASSFYCVKESQPKLTMPVTVVFHAIDLKEYAGAPTIYINRKPYPIWNQVNKNNTLGHLTFKEMSTGKEYDTSCQLMQ